MKKSKKLNLAEEAARFTADNDFGRSAAWEAVESEDSTAGATVAISIRLPGRQLQLLKEFARREGVGYQTLMKRWLDERLRDEFAARQDAKPAAKRLADLSKELEWASRELARRTG